MADPSPLVSIIVPVYNVEKYLEQCVTSIITQNYLNIEPILVNNASTDSSMKICMNFQSRDSRVKILNLEINEGVSSARNAGFEVANGQYVMFVDSDDYFANDSVVEMLVEKSLAYPESDFILFNFERYYQNKDVLKKSQPYPQEAIVGKSKLDKLKGLISSGIFPMSVWTKFIKKGFLNGSSITFLKGVAGEDMDWYIRMIDCCKDFTVINDHLYVYRRQVSTSLSSGFQAERFYSLFNVTKSIIIKYSKDNTEFSSYVLSYMAYELSILLGIADNFHGKERQIVLSELKKYRWLMKYKLNPKVKKVNTLISIVGFNNAVFILNNYIRNRELLKSFSK